MFAAFNKISIITIAVILLFAGFLGFETYSLSKNKVALENDLAGVKSNLASTSANFSKTRRERNEFEEAFQNEKSRVDFVAAQVGSITDTIGLLEKIKKVDPELLQKYSKVYFLNENYVPSKLSQIDPKYIFPKKDLYFHAGILSFLSSMLDGALGEGIDMKILSAYRSFDEQSDLKITYKVTFGSGANKFSADQGYSEHQLGSAIDFTTEKSGGSLVGFEKTPAYSWLEANGYKFGFILSYPKINSYYKYEPWHWRVVGRELAKKLHDEETYFYDLDQREIDQFRGSFFDQI